MKRNEIARKLWHDYLKVEYYQLSELAQAEWRAETATHSQPCYGANGERGGDDFIDAVYAQQGVRDDQ